MITNLEVAFLTPFLCTYMYTNVGRCCMYIYVWKSESFALVGINTYFNMKVSLGSKTCCHLIASSNDQQGFKVCPYACVDKY